MHDLLIERDEQDIQDELHQNGTQHFSLFTDYDVQLFRAGKHFHLYKKLGNHQVIHQNTKGTYFAVWAPNARSVSVVGNFNGWNRQNDPMYPRWDGSGIWELFIPALRQGEVYKYFIEANNGYTVEKGDPFAFYWEIPPATASKVWDIDFKWNDKKWIGKRGVDPVLSKPLSVYEMHPGSWRRVADEGGRFMTYRELAAELPAYCKYMGFTH